MNLYGISGCVILFVLIPLAAVLHERHLRRNGYNEDIDGTIQRHRRLPCSPNEKCPPDFAKGVGFRSGVLDHDSWASRVTRFTSSGTVTQSMTRSALGWAMHCSMFG
jgi:hypothetical protein